MSGEYINIYASARKAKGLTQERAAELIGISVESIRAYEAEARSPSDETALRMADVYVTQHLAYQHLQRSVLGKTILPEIEKRDVPSAILRLLKEVNDLIKLRDELIEIGSDGVIDDDERVRWEIIMKELADVEKAAAEVKYSEGAS